MDEFIKGGGQGPIVYSHRAFSLNFKARPEGNTCFFIGRERLKEKETSHGLIVARVNAPDGGGFQMLWSTRGDGERMDQVVLSA